MSRACTPTLCSATVHHLKQAAAPPAPHPPNEPLTPAPPRPPPPAPRHPEHKDSFNHNTPSGWRPHSHLALTHWYTGTGAAVRHGSHAMSVKQAACSCYTQMAPPSPAIAGWAPDHCPRPKLPRPSSHPQSFSNVIICLHSSSEPQDPWHGNDGPAGRGDSLAACKPSLLTYPASSHASRLSRIHVGSCPPSCIAAPPATTVRIPGLALPLW